jgi:uncharacterized alpha-E superfamily protein
LAAQVRTNLEFRSAPDILANLTQEMVSLQNSVSEISEAIGNRYFPANVMPTWVGEIS